MTFLVKWKKKTLTLTKNCRKSDDAPSEESLSDVAGDSEPIDAEGEESDDDAMFSS